MSERAWFAFSKQHPYSQVFGLFKPSDYLSSDFRNSIRANWKERFHLKQDQEIGLLTFQVYNSSMLMDQTSKRQEGTRTIIMANLIKEKHKVPVETWTNVLSMAIDVGLEEECMALIRTLRRNNIEIEYASILILIEYCIFKMVRNGGKKKIRSPNYRLRKTLV